MFDFGRNGYYSKCKDKLSNRNEVMKVRDKLKRTREELGLSVLQVAEMLGISTSHYYKIESGIRNPNFVLAGKIARLFNSNVNELFFANELDKTSKKLA